MSTTSKSIVVYPMKGMVWGTSHHKNVVTENTGDNSDLNDRPPVVAVKANSKTT